MAYELGDRLVVGVASSALFDLSKSDAYFRKHGEAKYRIYQNKRVDKTLRPGVAFPFIQRLLGLNDLRPGDPLVEVMILSHNDPMTGLRVMRSVQTHKLAMSRAVFTQGRSPYAYIKAFSMSLFLTGDRRDVDAAIAMGLPAGHVLPSSAKYDPNDRSLRVAFDFDGVLASDESEQVYKASGVLADYLEHESTNRDIPLAPGLLKPLLEDLNRIQKIEDQRRRADSSYEPRLRVSLVTARNAPAHERAVNSLRAWGVNVNDAFFLGGVEKSTVLQVLRPHIFFDDQQGHLDPASAHSAGVHIPYGIANEVRSAKSFSIDVSFPPSADDEVKWAAAGVSREVADDGAR
ncbi:5'-nucleotidase [Mycobacteroides abscessus]|uniref:5'-nucleotidase n=1 Tax=Mycobacteroides abscessus TaxID=36809 RepID=UPI0034CE4FE3